mmetsp:Transcript_21209/g.49123  ORF Transcript_21209/g.49123 Transcript_21209/m.49123 type:complete len:384 (+) Transcript_21209:117-1268(+)|eukprot:CAMPEP_0178403364 /NCGR_PEP_ID=MMETSP0689_2-20121128/17329_1 /TAXON_ID=160604 /ORGANISM="Amphidinium massartii, Strain CS-259" /LENGTH=383 /DNA_ID=CAMNT_0020024313 /DNA_START=103 /DNA_END=1254 /DNA_ORIENTATION=-
MKTAAVAFALSVAAVDGHAALTIPISRNVRRNLDKQQYDIYGLDAGGPSHLYTNNDGVFPGHSFPETHGLCGNSVGDGSEPMTSEENMEPTAIQATFVSGSIVELEVKVTAHHWGYYEFRICDVTVGPTTFATRTEAQACFDQHLLLRADPLPSCSVNDADPDCQPLDPNYPERWYLPLKGVNGDVHKMRYKLPAGFECTACTMQWYWPTSNACVPNQGQYDYFAYIESIGWDVTGWFTLHQSQWSQCSARCCGIQHTNGYGQEFWNCADISITASGATTAIGSSTATATAASSTETAATTLATVSTTVPVTSTAAPCLDLCLKTNLTYMDSTCIEYGDQGSCEGSFVSTAGGEAAVPCKWLGDCRCVADGAALMVCPKCEFA